MITERWALVNGIRTFWRSQDSWMYHARSFITAQRHHSEAIILGYFTLAITKALKFEARVNQFWAFAFNMPQIQKHAVCHSHGADVACSALKLPLGPDRRMETLILIAPAVEHDFRRNGLNDALRENRLGRVVILCSRNDMTLKWLARATRIALGWIPWGIGKAITYGYLGYIAAEKPARLHIDPEIRDRVIIYDMSPMDHNDYFEPVFVDRTHAIIAALGQRTEAEKIEGATL